MKLPSAIGLTVACDTEGSGLFPDDGARISAVSAAWRDPSTHEIQAFATPFDQGLWGSVSDADDDIGPLPLGDKLLPSNHRKRMEKLCKASGTAMFWSPNRLPSAYERLTAWLSRQRLVMQHKKYDCTMFRAGLRTRPDLAIDLMPSVFADTMLRQRVISPEHPTSLKPTAVRLQVGRQLGMDDGAEAKEAEALLPWKGPQADPRYDLIPWEVLGPYSRTDAILTLLVYEHELVHDLSDEDDPEVAHLLRLIRRQERLSAVLYGMEQRGVGFDVQWCLQQDAILAKLVTEAQSAVPFRPTPPGASKYFFGAPADGGLGLLPFSDKITPGGKGQVDEDVIARLIKNDTPGAREYETFAGLKAAREKWYTAWPSMVGLDGRLRTCYRQGRVVSNRLSVERWQSQAIPHDYQIPPGVEPIRKAFVEDDGWVLLECDVSQAEIRIAAVTADCQQMLSAIRKGISSHAAAAKLMFYPDVPLSKAKLDPGWQLNYDVAKRCNLGILYGAGVGVIHDTIYKFTGHDFSLDLVREWVTDWRHAFPPFVRALNAYADLASDQGWIRLIDGSRRYFSEWEPVHKAFNQRIQGDVAIAMEYSMLEADRRFPGALLLQIHDSLVVRAPADNADFVGQSLRSIMIRNFEALFKGVPFDADVKPFGRYAYDPA